MVIGDHFLKKIPVTQTLRATINNWDLLKLTSFCKAKDTVNKTKKHPTESEKIFTNPTTDRGLIFKIYLKIKKLDIKIPKKINLKVEQRSKQRILNRRNTIVFATIAFVHCFRGHVLNSILCWFIFHSVREGSNFIVCMMMSFNMMCCRHYLFPFVHVWHFCEDHLGTVVCIYFQILYCVPFVYD